VEENAVDELFSWWVLKRRGSVRRLQRINM
jgi:hypothetical protein